MLAMILVVYGVGLLCVLGVLAEALIDTRRPPNPFLHRIPYLPHATAAEIAATAPPPAPSTPAPAAVPLYDQAALSENLIEWTVDAFEQAAEHHCEREGAHGAHLYQCVGALCHCDGKDRTRST